MATVAHSHHGIGKSDTGRRIWAIVGGSSGNLVEWYDFYVYSFTALYFASEFFPSGDQTTQLLKSNADTAVRLGRYFGNRPQFWLELQSNYDLAIVEREHGAEIERRVRPADPI